MTTQRQTNKISQNQVQELRGQVLDWYAKHRRDLPWRAKADDIPDPYHVWLSEIMLQQTTVTAVAPYYRKFLQKWPTIQDLAAAAQDEVMQEWAGLGYYARARNLHACAKMVANDLHRQFPEEQKSLKELPGIGDYTSAAIRTIAFNRPATVMDGNIERVMARLFAVEDPLPKAKPVLKTYADYFFDDFEDRPGDLAQGLMDLGSGICTPKSPKCILCPVQKSCAARAKGIAEELPRKLKKKSKPQKQGIVYWAQNENSEILLHKRPEKGMLGGMIGLPTSEWNQKKTNHPDDLRIFSEPILAEAKSLKAKVLHSFTHFDLEMTLKTVACEKIDHSEYFWMNSEQIEEVGFPSLFKKAVKLFQNS